jgi:DNA-binding CsgD family transcriptional regulator
MHRLRLAIGDAARGLRRLVVLGDGSRRVSLAAVPLPSTEAAAVPIALLIIGKRQVCEPLSVQWFARSASLTPAETRVLEALCRGLEPREVARALDVGMATIRTQIISIRAKTGADSIRDLVRQVALLPPMLSVLRGTG